MFFFFSDMKSSQVDDVSDNINCSAYSHMYTHTATNAYVSDSIRAHACEYTDVIVFGGINRHMHVPSSDVHVIRCKRHYVYLRNHTKRVLHNITYSLEDPVCRANEHQDFRILHSSVILYLDGNEGMQSEGGNRMIVFGGINQTEPTNRFASLKLV